MRKINPNAPAFPHHRPEESNGAGIVTWQAETYPGLSIRAYFAGLALASAYDCYKTGRNQDEGEHAVDLGDGPTDIDPTIIAEYAVTLADALIAALNAEAP